MLLKVLNTENASIGRICDGNAFSALDAYIKYVCIGDSYIMSPYARGFWVK